MIVQQQQKQLLSSHPLFLEGNKPWKLKLFFDHPLPSSSKQLIIAYGNHQSNAMLSLFQLFHALRFQTNAEVHYYTHRIHHPSQATTSNYQQVLQLCRENSRLHCIEKQDCFHVQQLLHHFEPLALQHDSYHINEFLSQPIIYLKQGFSNHVLAAYGITQLAKQISELLLANSSAPSLLVLPSGSGMTSFYLAKYFFVHHLPIHVFTCNVLLKKTENLIQEIAKMHPENATMVQQLISSGYYQIQNETRKIQQWNSPPLLEIYNEVRELFGVELDKRYALFTLDQVLRNNLNEKYSNIYYYHTGGTFGNHSL